MKSGCTISLVLGSLNLETVVKVICYINFHAFICLKSIFLFLVLFHSFSPGSLSSSSLIICHKGRALMLFSFHQFILEQYDNPMSRKLNDIVNEIRRQRCSYLRYRQFSSLLVPLDVIFCSMAFVIILTCFSTFLLSFLILQLATVQKGGSVRLVYDKIHYLTPFYDTFEFL